MTTPSDADRDPAELARTDPPVGANGPPSWHEPTGDAETAPVLVPDAADTEQPAPVDQQPTAPDPTAPDPTAPDPTAPDPTAPDPTAPGPTDAGPQHVDPQRVERQRTRPQLSDTADADRAEVMGTSADVVGADLAEPTPPAAPTPRPPRAPTRPGPVATVPPPQRAPATEGAADWGRVEPDGSVFVRTGDGERLVGQVPDVSVNEALGFFTRKYDELAFEVQLLEQRVHGGALSPEDASASIRQVQRTVAGAHAVGDLDALVERLQALTAAVAEQRARRKAERAERLTEAKAEKERIALEAEQLSAANDWRNGADRLRELLDQWKALPRLDKGVDDTLWRRFSTARTSYTRRRKTHFAELNEKREEARVVKERLVKEAEALAGSTEWAPTASAYRDLMRRWKAAGSAPKKLDDQLWKRFRTAQDSFFAARDAATAAQDAEFTGNAAKKEALLVEAEALLPVTDLSSAKAAFRSIAERWDAAGKVPRERMKELETRMRRVEQAIRGVEDEKWRRSNPEAHARAADTVAQLESTLAGLRSQHDRATAAGNDKLAADLVAAIEARESWLTQARKALAEFSP